MAAAALEKNQQMPTAPAARTAYSPSLMPPTNPPRESADARNGLAKDLSEVLGCEVEEIQASDYNAIIEALRTGKADMAYMGSQALALGVERTDLEPIVMKAEDGDPEKAVYHSVLIASSDNDAINSIEDI